LTVSVLKKLKLKIFTSAADVGGKDWLVVMGLRVPNLLYSMWSVSV